MNNKEMAALFEELADIMEIAGEDFFKILSYRKAAESIVKLKDSITEMSVQKIGGIPGVGKAISEKIQAALDKGTFPTLEKWRATGFGTLRPLLRLEGVTPRKLSNLLRSLRIEKIDDIRRLVEKGEFQKLEIVDRKVKDSIVEFITEMRQ